MTDPKKLVPECTCPPDEVEKPTPPSNGEAFAEDIFQRYAKSLEFPSSPAEDAPQDAPEEPPTPPSLAPPDAAAAFVGESCEPNRKAFTSTAEIMAAARGWCDEHAAMPFGPRTLASQLRRMGGQPHSNGTRRGWRGIKLR